MPRVAAVVVVLFALAGCSGPAGETNEGPAGSSTMPATVAVGTEVVPEDPIVASCQVTRTAANTALGYGVNPDTALDRKIHCPLTDVADDLSMFEYAVVEVAWEAQTTETQVGLRVSAACQDGDQPETTGQNCVVAKAVGALSPLTVLLIADQLDRYADAEPSAYVFTEGASVEHAFDLRISLFPSGPVPDAYTGFRFL